MHVYMYMYMYVCMYVCMYIYKETGARRTPLGVSRSCPGLSPKGP